MVTAQLCFYSKYDKFVEDEVTIGKGMPFILTAVGSKDDEGGDDYTAIWTRIEGEYPEIVGMANEGRVVYFNAPNKPAMIIMCLTVRDNKTQNDASTDIKIDVLDITEEQVTDTTTDRDRDRDRLTD